MELGTKIPELSSGASGTDAHYCGRTRVRDTTMAGFLYPDLKMRVSLTLRDADPLAISLDRFQNYRCCKNNSFGL